MWGEQKSSAPLLLHILAGKGRGKTKGTEVSPLTGLESSVVVAKLHHRLLETYH
jgi:hypothetical protein